MVLKMVSLEADCTGGTSGQIGEDSKRLVGPNGVEAQVVTQLVHDQLQHAVQRARDHVRRHEYPEPGCCHGPVCHVQLKAKRGHGQQKRARLLDKQLRDLGVLGQDELATSGMWLIRLNPMEIVLVLRHLWCSQIRHLFGTRRLSVWRHAFN